MKITDMGVDSYPKMVAGVVIAWVINTILYFIFGMIVFFQTVFFIGAIGMILDYIKFKNENKKNTSYKIENATQS